MLAKYPRVFPMRETPYCYASRQAWEGEPYDSVCMERLSIKGSNKEMIRLSRWKEGKHAIRFIDVAPEQWITLFREAVYAGVFSESEKNEMLSALQ